MPVSLPRRFDASVPATVGKRQRRKTIALIGAESAFERDSNNFCKLSMVGCLLGMLLGTGQRAIFASVSALLLVACALLVVAPRDPLSHRGTFLLQATLPAIKEEVSKSLKDAFKTDVVMLSKKIDGSLRSLDSINLNHVDSAQVSQIFAKAKKAFSDVQEAKDIAVRAQIAAAKADAFLIDAEKSKKAAIATSSMATKAAAEATKAASAVKAKLKSASAESERLSKAAREAHSAYLVSKNIASVLKGKADTANKLAVAAEQASKSAAAQAAAAKKAASAAAAALAAAVKDHALKLKELDALNAAVKKARAVRDAAAAAQRTALAQVAQTKSANSAKLSAAQKAAHTAEVDLKAKVKAAAVASRLLRIAGQTRKAKQSAAIAAAAAFSKVEHDLKSLQLHAAKSKAASLVAEANSVKAAREANAALKNYLARKQSSLTWPGKKPVLKFH